MRSLALACLAVGMSASTVHAGFITVNTFNNSTPATVSFDDGYFLATSLRAGKRSR